MGRAGYAAGYRLVLVHQAGVALNVFLIFVRKSGQAVQNHFGSTVADGTVCRKENTFGSFTQYFQIFRRGFVIQDFFQQISQRAQADTAGNAFATALGMTHAHKGEGDVNRTNTAGTGFQTSFHGLVHCVENFL